MPLTKPGARSRSTSPRSRSGLLKNSCGRDERVERTFRLASEFFILDIRSRLQPPTDCTFRFFQQPATAVIGTWWIVSNQVLPRACRSFANRKWIEALPRQETRIVESRQSRFHGEVVRRVTACLLFAVLGLALLAPTVAHARTAKTKQTKDQKVAAKQYKKYSKQQAKQQKKQLKAQKKANQKFNKGRPTITVT
jgi:hypothetical protein